MTEFPDRPRLELLEPGWYELLEDYRWTDGERRVTVRAGFQCDLASVPKLFHSIIGRKDLGVGPPLIHDAFYYCRGETIASDFVEYEIDRNNHWYEANISRREADLIFYEMMRQKGFWRIKARPAYYAVRAFGYFAWRATREGNNR